MPQCKRCGRVAATAELRKTPGGNFVCKTNRDRCTLTARAGEWPSKIDGLAEELMRYADLVKTSCNREDVMRALARCKTLRDYYTKLITELAMRASLEGNTQKAVAAALDVPPSALTGLKQGAREDRAEREALAT
jgi:hypothetical protein